MYHNEFLDNIKQWWDIYVEGKIMYKVFTKL